jgi:hypothetical protein
LEQQVPERVDEVVRPFGPVEVKHIARLGAGWDDCRDSVRDGDPKVAIGYWDGEDLPFYARRA